GARADVKLPSVIGSHMVLQRDRPLPVWGWADPGEEVTVQLRESKASATADANGKWNVTLPHMQADGKTHTLTVSGKNKGVQQDVLRGEVWVGSGQSNMEWSVNASAAPRETAAAANHPEIRLFHVPKVQRPAPDKDVRASWKVCSPTSVPRFSA